MMFHFILDGFIIIGLSLVIMKYVFYKESVALIEAVRLLRKGRS